MFSPFSVPVPVQAVGGRSKWLTHTDSCPTFTDRQRWEPHISQVKVKEAVTESWLFLVS